MTRRTVTLLLIALLPVVLLKAQTLLTGRVVAEQPDKPLVRVSVVAEDKSRKPVAYALTKSDGTFTVKLPSGRAFDALTFSLLGYAKQCIKAAEFKNGQTVVMKEEEYNLQEVEVKSQRLRQRNDTLSYSVSGFRHQQDRSIADVIAKMPGLEVDANGTIKYQGKAINNFYIEGMDLMGNQYALATENLNAMKVKEVQVLRNHQDVKTLRGTQFSDRAALNLVLEEDAKGVWTGLVEAGLGTTMQENEAERLLRDGRLMGMMFGGRMQSLSMYKWNNTGKSIKDEVRDLVSSNRTTDDVSNITPDIKMEAPDLMEHRYLMNDSRLLATNWLTKMGKDGTMRLQLNGFIDQTRGHRSTQTVYSDAMGGAFITELEEGKANSSEWQGELEYKYNGSQLYVCNVAGGYMDFNNSWAETRLNGTAVRQEARPHRWRIKDDLQIVRSLGNNRSLQFNASAKYSFLPGTLLLTDMTTQHVDQHNTEACADITFRHKLFHRLNVSWLAGIDYSRQQFSVWHDGTAPQGDRCSLLNGHVMPSVSVRTGSLSWGASANLRLLSRHFMEYTDNRIIIEPSANLSYKITGRLQARASYHYGWTPSLLTEMTRIPLFNNYRSYTTGTGSFFASGRHRGLLRMEYTDPVHGLFGYIDAFYTYQDKMPVYNRLLDGVMYHREATGTYNNRSLWQLNGRVSRSLGTMKFIVAIDGKMQRSYFNTMMRGQQWPFRYDNYQTGISFSLRPLSFLSLEEKSQYRYSKQICRDNREQDSPGLRSFTHSLKLFMMPGKWQLEWNHEIYHSNDHSVSFTYFSDLQVSYRTKTYEAGISINNIWGSKNYERRLIDADATIFTVNSLRPREIMIKGSLNL